MAFGGTVKLTGESEYRQAIKNITNDLKSMSKSLKDQTADFASNSKSMSSNASEQKKLNDTIKNQQSEISKAKGAMASYQTELTKQQTTHNALTREYKNAVLELEKIRKASGEASDEYQKQQSVVDKLGAELDDSNRSMNASKEAMAELKSEINNSQKTIDNTQKSLDDLGNEAEEAGDKAKKGGDGFTVMKGILADLGARAISSAVSGLKSLGGAFVSIGKEAYANYGQYEQLVGGVETLFGESSSKLIEYAQGAYKTAGISANTYMEQATSFSATLLQGLGGDTEKTVKYADLAITDMSDNANKMGTDIGMIQNAYQGFAKDNYTMLDNLKLGYGGTQSEMARLINDSGVLGDAVEVTAETVKDVPFDKIIEAIHKTQQEIGITGTTTLEAEKTIEGSTAAMKASWENLLTGIADEDQDISPLVDNFVEQVIAMGQNSAPRIKQIIEGIGEVVSAMWNEVLPELADSVPELEPFISKLLWLKDNANKIAIAIGAVAAALVGMKIVSAINQITTLVGVIKSWELASKLQTIQIYAMIAAEKAQALASKGVAIAQGALNAVMNANPIVLVVTAIAALAAGLVLAYKKSETFRNIVNGVWESIKNVCMPIIENIVEAVKSAWETIKNVTEPIWNAIKEVISVVLGLIVVGVMKGFEKMRDLVTKVWDAIKTATTKVWDGIQTYIVPLVTAIKEKLSAVFNAIKTTVTNIWNGIKTVTSTVWNAIKSVTSTVWESIKNAVSKPINAAKSTVSNVVNSVKSKVSGVWDSIKSTTQKTWESIKSAITKPINKAWDVVRGVVDKLKGAFNFSWKLPDLKLPHLSVSGGKAPYGIGGKGSLPSFSIDWYANGGVFEDGARIVGLGEAGAEAIVPLENNTKWIKRVASEMKANMDAPTSVGQTFDYVKMVDAFKDALSQMKVELDDDEVGRFIDKTVTRLVYN